LETSKREDEQWIKNILGGSHWRRYHLPPSIALSQLGDHYKQGAGGQHFFLRQASSPLCIDTIKQAQELPFFCNDDPSNVASPRVIAADWQCVTPLWWIAKAGWLEHILKSVGDKREGVAGEQPVRVY
jgi:hypothetical protein